MTMSKSCMILRRAFSTVAPRALRPIFSPVILSATVNQMDISNNHHAHHFCTDAKKNLLHRKIATALKTQMETPKIKALKEGIPPVPADFPFTIRQFGYACCNLYLTRELDGESIEVRASIPGRLQSSTYHDNILKESTADIAPCVHLKVEISKENGPGLDIGVSVSSDDIRVDGFWVDEPVPDSDDRHFFGYHEVKDGSELQLALGEYVEMRGIEKKYAEFLFNYIVESHKSRPVVVLEKLQNYFEE